MGHTCADVSWPRIALFRRGLRLGLGLVISDSVN